MFNPKVSIIINNFNYADYVEVAVESATGQTYANKEIIVVDDGSTDTSREILWRYNSQVKLVFKENGGESSGRNEGLKHVSGDIVAFLDADDYWLPHTVSTVVQHWRDTYTKLQFPLMVVDHDGKQTGGLMPRCRLDSGRVEQMLLTTGRYITTPTSGNFYSRAFLERIFPTPISEWPQSMDSYAATYAGFYGEIGAINQPLGYYRVHGTNATRVSVQGVDLKRVQMLMERGLRLRRLIETIARENNLQYNPGIVTRHWLYVKLELASLKLSPGASVSRLLACTWHLYKSALTSRELTFIAKMELLAWGAAVVILPRQACQPVLNVAFELAPKSRLVQFFRA